ncbi:MAG: TonB-dependent receptor [Rhizomicrobium sp.]
MTTALSPMAALADTASSPNTIETVVVTAEKRAVDIQQVPASVSAVPGAELQRLGLKGLDDYAQYVPGLEIHQTGSPGQGSVTLRGISDGLGGQGSLVGYYINDTPLGSSGNYADADQFSLDLLPYDVDRLEVLRGPQGTLYGAGAMGGLIKYVLTQADPSGFSVRAGAEINSTGDSGAPGYSFRAAVNIPLDDTLAIRVSGFDQQDQGYINNVRLGLKGVNGDQQYGGRAAVTWLPASNVTVNLNAIWYRQDSDDPNLVRLDNLVTHTDSRGTVFYTGSPTLGSLAENNFFRAPLKKNINYYSGTVNWDLGWAQATSATSYAKTTTLQPSDRTDTFGSMAGDIPAYLGYNFSLDKFTQEVRLASPTDQTVAWLAGAYYTREISKFDQALFSGLVQPLPLDLAGTPYEGVQLPLNYQEVALFGDVTVNFSSKFDVTGGVRFSRNDQQFHEIVAINGVTAIDAPGKSGESNWTWQGNARYHFDDNTMAYVRIASGYRPGSPNAALPGGPVPPPAQSDTLINYEVGLKATFLDGKAVLDIAAFDVEWSNFQTNVTVNSQSYLGNAGSAYSRGVELEGSVIPLDGLRVGFDGAYTDAEIASIGAGGTNFLLGYQLAGVPKFSGGLNAEYTWAAFENWQANVGGSIHYTDSELVASPTDTSFNTMDPAYTRIDLRAGLSNDNYQINFYVHNLTDERVYLQQAVLSSAFGLGGGAPIAISSYVLQPRTIGLSFDLKY